MKKIIIVIIVTVVIILLAVVAVFLFTDLDESPEYQRCIKKAGKANLIDCESFRR
ncbi:MAG: hypothetical protein Q7K65_01575 [Candidatus Buchananbacteria bacterium]|nr:hypothetical protein [Candidatus Buchananbacteria bacterium]